MSSRPSPWRARWLRALSFASIGCIVASSWLTSVSAQCPELSVPMAGLPQAGAEFGTSLALAGDVAVIGAPGWTPPGGTADGAAIVSVFTGSAWVSTMLPRPTTLSPGCRFGQSVAINDDATIIAVGAPLHDAAAVDCGKVVVYEWNVALSQWQITLDVDGVFTNGLFGWSVAADGQRVAAGEPGGVFALGSVNVTRRTAPSTWVADGLLVGVEPFAGFGFSVALSGDLLAIGAPLDDEPLVDQGSLDVFEALGGVWTLREHVVEPVGEAGSFFGWSVDLDDELLVAGAPGQSTNTPGGYGRVYTWDGTEYDWQLVHWSFDAATRVGQSVSIAHDRVAMGEPGDDAHGVAAGLLSCYQRSPWGYWPLEGAVLASSSPDAGAQFGFATAVSGRRMLTSQPFADPGGAASAGLVYAYDLDSRTDHTDLGHGLAGQAGLVPTMTGDGGMCETAFEWLVVEDVRASAPVWVVFGIDLEPLPFKGGVLVPKADVVLSLGSASAMGTTGLGFTMPSGLPAFSLWWQCWAKDADGVWGFSATNAVRSDYPPF